MLHKYYMTNDYMIHLEIAMQHMITEVEENKEVNIIKGTYTAEQLMERGRVINYNE